jgi:amino acid permease
MAIGGLIGAGFFLGSGVAISQAGPALLLAYIIAGAVMYLILRALGELALAGPAAGSLSTYATRFIGPLPGFITGWSYWLARILGGIAEVTGIRLLLRHWYPGTPQLAPALCATLLLHAINMSTIRSFGELEYLILWIWVAIAISDLLYSQASSKGQARRRQFSTARFSVYELGHSPGDRRRRCDACPERQQPHHLLHAGVMVRIADRSLLRNRAQAIHYEVTRLEIPNVTEHH